MGHSLEQLGRFDSAGLFLDRLDVLAKGTAGTEPVRINELDRGINDLYRADLLAERNDYLAALQQLQKAIIIFSPHFANPDIMVNPADFVGSFASYRLFDALYRKAQLLMQLYRSQPRDQWLLAAYDAYRTSLSILRYIEKSYDTDDSKLFLKKKNGAVIRDALEVCLELHRRYPGKDYLQQAFGISERNKASVIAANLRERSRGLPDNGSLQKEEDIKYNIARLNVKGEETTDKVTLQTIAQEKSGYEIALAQLQKQLEKNGNYYKLKYEDTVPGIGTLQAHLESNQALISFCQTGEALHAFVLTRTSFNYVRIDSLAALQKDVSDWLELLKTVENGRKFKGGPLGERLGRILIKPIRAMVPDQDEWIIVPDGFLFFLPFESLPSGTGEKTMLETTTISYQFASRLILPPEPRADKPAQETGVLAFAPFTGDRFLSTGPYRFPPLPASQDEVAELPGSRYSGREATKSRFLRELNRYPILHLATHAVSSANNAAGSFIAFYPGSDTPIDDCLFLEELYGLDLNNTRLVVISACETGQGELVSNEGVISLARAFAYAGCASSISSLWKADDQATSYILKRFYVYLKRGDKKSTALRQAKLDYLGSGTVNKSPAFWSHLVLIGDTAPLYPRSLSWWWALMLAPVAGGVWWAAKKRRESR